MSAGSLGDMGAPLVGSRVREERKAAEVVAGGSMSEAIGGAGALVLSIVGLAGVLPSWMASISAICIGAAVLLRGFALTARYYSLLDETGAGEVESAELGSGIGAEVFGGSAALVLGILALVGIYPLILCPVAAIVIGATLLIGCASNSRLNDMIVDRWHSLHSGTGRRLASDLLSAANGAQALVGVGVVVLGIVALCNNNYYHQTLSLVAFLSAGASVLLSGGTVTGKMMTLLTRTSHHRVGTAGV